MERKNLIKYYVAHLLYNLAFAFLTGAVVQGFLAKQGLSENQIYTYASISTWAQVFTMSLMTFFSARIKKVKLWTTIFAGSLLVSAIILILSALLPNLKGNTLALYIFIVSAISFAGVGVYNILSYCLPYRVMDMKEYGKITGISSMIIGAVVFGATTLYATITSKLDLVKVFVFFIIFSVVALVVSVCLFKSLKEINKQEEQKTNAKEEIVAVFKNKDTYILMLPNFIRGIATGIVGVIAVLAMSGGIIVESQASIVTIVLQAGLLVGNLLFVLTCKRFKTRTAMFISNTIFCILLPFAFTFGTIGFIIVLVISLIFRCLVDTAIPVLVTEIIPKDEIGPFTSIRMLVFTAGQAVAPMLITPISNSVGGVGVLVVAAVLQFLCGLVYFIVAKIKKENVAKL